MANAPHLPVHLGAMSEAVRFQVAFYAPGGPGAAEGLQVRAAARGTDVSLAQGLTCVRASPEPGCWQGHIGSALLPYLRKTTCSRLACCLVKPTWPNVGTAAPHLPGVLCCVQEGDVLLSNHPQLAGGSHLPDITVITPVFSGGRVVFFVASRGHHADIGGISPGSMPPNSKVLAEEGAAVVSFKLVRDGAFQVCTLWAVGCALHTCEVADGCDGCWKGQECMCRGGQGVGGVGHQLPPYSYHTTRWRFLRSLVVIAVVPDSLHVLISRATCRRPASLSCSWRLASWGTCCRAAAAPATSATT